MTLTLTAQGQWARPRHNIDTGQDGPVPPQGPMTAIVAWGTANRAIYVPVRVPTRVVVRELGVVCATTATGNIDIGVYSSTGTLLVSTGSTVKSGSQGVQAVDITDTTLGPGLFYLALNNDTTTDTFAGFTPTVPMCTAWGVLAEAVGAVTLPATATWAQDNTLALCPSTAMLLVTEVS